MTKDVVGLADGSPGFHPKYYRLLRSETPPEETRRATMWSKPGPASGWCGQFGVNQFTAKTGNTLVSELSRPAMTLLVTLNGAEGE
jgi:hypothetical protein